MSNKEIWDSDERYTDRGLKVLIKCESVIEELIEELISQNPDLTTRDIFCIVVEATNDIVIKRRL
jgi:hypothetical protein